MVWATHSKVPGFTPFFIHIWAAWRGKLEWSNVKTLAKGIPKGNIATIPLGGKFIHTKIWGTSPKCINTQKQEKKTIISENKNILNPVIIFFWTRIVIPPSFDSFCKSFIQENLKYNKVDKASNPWGNNDPLFYSRLLVSFSS